MILAGGSDPTQDGRHRLTWWNIPGLSHQQRRLGQRAFPNMNLAVVALRDASVDGVELPNVIYGVVERPENAVTSQTKP